MPRNSVRRRTSEKEDYAPKSMKDLKTPMENSFFDESPKQPSKLGAIIENFCDTTSMHGCGQISGAKLTVVRFIWCVLTFVAVGGLFFHLWSIFDGYLKWPKQTKVTLGFDNLVYPSITICNVNLIRKSAMERSESMRQLKELADFIDPDNRLPTSDDPGTFGLNLHNVTNATLQSIDTEADSIGILYGDVNFTSYDEDLFDVDVNETSDDDWVTNKDTMYLLDEVFHNLYMHVNRKSRERSGHDIKEMLLSCTFNGYSCYPENFTLHQTSSFGNCWTLSSRKLVAKSTGPKAGLSLVLYLQTDEFIKGLTNGYGARIVIHYPETRPLPHNEGIFIPAATETSIGLLQKSIHRLDYPYGVCDNGVAFKERYRFHYTRQACQTICEITELIQTCGCYGNFHEELAPLVDKAAYFCNSTKDRICMNKVNRRLQQKRTVCKCDNPCTEVTYEQTVSSRQWPSESFSRVLLEALCVKDNSTCQSIATKLRDRHLENNFVKLNFFYESLNYETIEEEPLIDIFQFLASIGGALGLWIGLSMLSFCEIMQLAGEVVHHFLHRCRHEDRVFRKKIAVELS